MKDNLIEEKVFVVEVRGKGEGEGGIWYVIQLLLTPITMYVLIQK